MKTDNIMNLFNTHDIVSSSRKCPEGKTWSNALNMCVGKPRTLDKAYIPRGGGK